MSWGRSISGTAAQVKEQAAQFAASVLDMDTKYGATEQTKAGHQGQATAAEKALGDIVEAYPEGTVFSGSVSGSVTDGKSGHLNIGYTVSIPAVQVE